MDKLDAALLKKIEHALDIKFQGWQSDYILDIPRVLDMRNTGRGTGKTTIYIIKLLFSDEKPIRAYDLEEMAEKSDWYCVTDTYNRKDPHYTKWFREKLRDIYDKLEEKGLNPRPVFFTKERDCPYLVDCWEEDWSYCQRDDKPLTPNSPVTNDKQYRNI